MGIISRLRNRSKDAVTDPRQEPDYVVGCVFEEQVFCNLICLESVCGRPQRGEEWEFESITYAQAEKTPYTCEGCEEPLLEKQGKTPRTFTCGTCGDTYTPGHATGDLFNCCGMKMNDSVRELPRERKLERLRAA